MPRKPKPATTAETPPPAAVVAAEIARTHLRYDPNTGAITRLTGRRAGQSACSRHCAGYQSVRLGKKNYLAHRVAWLIVYGRWPAHQIDHINGDRADNRLANLRECTNAQNCQNVRSHRDGTSRFVGVSLNNHSKSRPWQAQICVNGRQRNLGYFATEEDALAARIAAKARLHTFNPIQECAL